MNDYRVKPREVPQLEDRAAGIYPLPARLTMMALVALVIGLVGFGIGLAIAPGRAWAALLVNTVFWAGLCAASLVVTATFNIAVSWWGRLFQRILSGLAAYLPFSWIPLVALWFGRHYVFPWIGQEHSPWLGEVAVFARDILILIAFAALGLYYVSRMLRLDMGMLVNDGRLERKGLAARLSANWRGYTEERDRSLRAQRMLAPVIVLFYVFGFSILSVDLEMSQTPDFRSTMFPVIYWIGCYYAAFASAAVLARLWRGVGPLREFFVGPNVRDLGNMMWGACIFFAYVLWGQYFVFWMGNLPHEAGWHIARWRTMPWTVLAWTMLVTTFIAPFFLLFARGLKRNLMTLSAIAILPIVGVLLNRFLNIYPSLPNLGRSTFGLVEVLVTIGFVGAVALPYLWLMRRVPPFPVEDPLFFNAIAARGVEV